MFLGLRTVVYPAPDLAASKAWWADVLGIRPYFDETFYVGFNPGGYELGLNPNADPSAGPRTYWGVRDIEAAGKHLVAVGAVVVEAVQDVGEGIKLGVFRSPNGDLVGVIENPMFEIQPAPGTESDGPGRLRSQIGLAADRKRIESRPWFSREPRFRTVIATYRPVT